MTKKFDYPYHKSYLNYLQNVIHASPEATANAENSINYFWRFYLGVRQNQAQIEEVKASDIRAFLDYLELDHKYTFRTINKYLTYLRKYFTYLFEYQNIKTLPTISVRDRHIDRSKTVVTNLLPFLDDFLANQELSLTSKKALLLTLYGFSVKRLIILHFSDVKGQINQKSHLAWLNTNLTFDNPNPLIFSKTGGQALSSDRMIRLSLAADQEKVALPLSLQDLANSYIYTLVANPKISDQTLTDKLHCSRKTLNYYKSNLDKYQIVDYQSFLQKQKN